MAPFLPHLLNKTYHLFRSSPTYHYPFDTYSKTTINFDEFVQVILEKELENLSKELKFHFEIESENLKLALQFGKGYIEKFVVGEIEKVVKIVDSGVEDTILSIYGFHMKFDIGTVDVLPLKSDLFSTLQPNEKMEDGDGKVINLNCYFLTEQSSAQPHGICSQLLISGPSPLIVSTLQFLQPYLDIRISACHLAPHHLNDALAYAFHLMYTSPKSIKANLEFKYKFNQNKFEHDELKDLSLNLSFDQAKELFDLSSDFDNQGKETITRLNDHFHQCMGFPLETLRLIKFVTPLLALDTTGKVKLPYPFPRSLYPELLTILARIAL